MSLQIEKLSDTLILIHDGSTNIMEIDTENGVRINSAFRIGTDFISPSASELAAINGLTSTAAELNIMDGVTKTAAQINLLVAGVAGGYKIARGIRTTGAASEDVVTGLATVVAAVTCLVGDPSTTHLWTSCTPGDQAGAPAAGSIRIKSWKPTANDNVTPIDATSTFANTAWIAIGT